MNELTLSAALLIGLLGNTHCIGMCGGVSALLSMGQSSPRWSLLLAYNLGRILTYTSLGILLGFFGDQLTQLSPLAGPLFRTLAGLLMIAMGLYMMQWWMGLTRIEAMAAGLWRCVQPLTRKVLPANNMIQAMGLGLIWGLLPCGLVYTTLSWALLAANWQHSGLLMLAFGVGTLPVMLFTGLLGQRVIRFLQGRQLRILAGALIIILGLLTLILPWLHLIIHTKRLF
ncbi:MAG: sulfite exporter TauE/SafE family protein [Gammaproteobacteria bacterium]|nr:sulfite exporter TauE/SafE family protein [Gammaproteobacteria bacterium]